MSADLVFTQVSSQVAPPSGTSSIYAKTDGNFYTMNSSGTESSLVGPTGPTGATGPGVPSGGSAGQIIRKSSSTNYDTAWASFISQLLTNTGAIGSPQSITASGGIAPSNSTPLECQFIQGSGGAVTVTNTQPVAVGTMLGQILILYGTSDTATVTLNNGSNLSMNGNITLGLDDMIALLWNGTYWNELARRR